jgi:hypothetical protein
MEATEEHPGWIPDSEALKGSPPVTKDEAMEQASRDAGKAAQEREAAWRTTED